MKIILISVVLLFGSFLAKSQEIQKKLDSLKVLLASQSDEDKYQSQMEAGKLLLRLNPDSARAVFSDMQNEYSSQPYKQTMCMGYEAVALTYLGMNVASDSLFTLARKKSDQIGDYHMSTTLLSNQAINYFYLGDYDRALQNFEEFLLQAQAEQNMEDIALVSNNLGLLNLNMGNHYKSLKGLLIAVEAFDSLGEESSLASVYNNIAINHRELDNYEKAISYNKRSIAIKKKLGDDLGMISSCLNIGSCYQYLKKMDSALYYHQRALQLSEKLKDQRNIFNSLGSLVKIYIDLEEYEKAAEISNRAQQMVSENQDDVEMKLRLNLDDAFLKLQTGQLKAALAKAEQATEESKELEFLMVAVYGQEVLSEIYAQLGRFEDAYQSHVTYKQLADSILNESKTKAVAELETKYETEKKEQQIALQKAEIARHEALNNLNLVIISGLIFAVLAMIIILFLARSRSRKKEALLIQEAELNLREAQIEAAISSQEQERTRFAQDLHDGFGQMISLLNLNLKSLEKEGSDKEQVFEQSTQVLDDMYQELKGICFNLMPQTLIKNGITAAINEFAARVNQTDKVTIETDFFGLEERLTEVQEISLYRITQEWVNNMLKYSDAERVNIQITKDEQEITLMIEDNGTGFDLEILKSGKGNGWRNMNSRTNLMKGELEVDTQPGMKGNTLIVNAPVMVRTLSELEMEKV